MSQSDLLAFLRHGQAPFFRLPLSRTGDESLRDIADGADAVLLGVPWDGGTTLHPGARHAPFAVRHESLALPGYDPVLDVDVFHDLVVKDGGNVALTPFSPALMHDVVAGDVGSVVDASAVPFVVGGDHSVTLPALRAVAARHGPVAVVHVDAHADLTEDHVWLAPHHHGTWLRHALDEGLVRRGALVQVGLRGPYKGPDEVGRTLGHGGVVFSADDVGDDVASTIAAVRAAVGAGPVYVSVDVDAVDPAFAPGTGVRVAGGLTSREVLRLVRGLAGLHIVGFDVVEVCPARDVSGVTSLLAAQLLLAGLAVVATGKGRVQAARAG